MLTDLTSILPPEAFMPHGHCYYWNPFILWSHAISDSIIALAYFIIPFSLFEIVRNRKDFRYTWMVTLFAVFIFSCGATHVMDVIVIWQPYYMVDSIFRIITALAAMGTAFMLIHVTPSLKLIPSIQKWKKMNEELLSLNESLEEKVKQRTQALAQSAATFEFVTDTIPQLVWTATPDGKFEYFNKNWFDYTQLEYNQSKDLGWKAVIHQEDIQQVNNTWAHSVASGEPFEMECRIKQGASDAYRWHLVRALAMRDEPGDVEKWFGTATDINDRVIQNNELKKVNEELDNFVYTASHDLKAPLTNLEGLVNLSEKKSAEPGFILQLLPMMRKQVENLKLIINDLADVGRIEREVAEDFEEVSMKEIVDEFTLANNRVIKDTNTTLNAELIADRIVFSKRHLRSVVFNLLDNAIKYRKDDTAPRVFISSKWSAGYWLLVVKDNGKGIDNKFKHRIFDMFKRFDRDTEGTGIGLYIVKRVAEKYQGSIEVKSKEGNGCTFTVKIPIVNVKGSDA